MCFIKINWREAWREAWRVFGNLGNRHFVKNIRISWTKTCLFRCIFLIFKEYINGNMFCLKSRCEPALPCCVALNWPRESASTSLCRLIESFEPTSASLALVARTRSVSLFLSSSALDPVRFRCGAQTGRLKTSTTAGSLEMAARSLKARPGALELAVPACSDSISPSWFSFFRFLFLSISLTDHEDIYIYIYIYIEIHMYTQC